MLYAVSIWYYPIVSLNLSPFRASTLLSRFETQPHLRTTYQLNKPFMCDHIKVMFPFGSGLQSGSQLGINSIFVSLSRPSSQSSLSIQLNSFYRYSGFNTRRPLHFREF